MKNPDITGVSGSLGESMSSSGSKKILCDGGTSDNPQFFSHQQICHDFFQLMKAPLASGEYLSENDDKYVLVNEEAVRVMGMVDPVGKQILAAINSRTDEYYTIKGVVKDYNFENLRQPVKPIILSVDKYPFNLYVKTTRGGTKSAIASVEKMWNEYNPNYQFTYRFLEDDFALMYKTELRMGQLLDIFAFIAIFISCLGLFGLVTFIAETKTKEIGIRKVFGASTTDIINLLSKQFLILVGIAMLIAFPLAYYLLERMLQDYAYRIEIGWQLFALAGLITLILTIVTVGWQAIKTATTNPADIIMSCD